jgi:hypothetical protein
MPRTVEMAAEDEGQLEELGIIGRLIWSISAATADALCRIAGVGGSSKIAGDGARVRSAPALC